MHTWSEKSESAKSKQCTYLKYIDKTLNDKIK